MLSAAQLTIVSRLNKRHLRKVIVTWDILLANDPVLRSAP